MFQSIPAAAYHTIATCSRGGVLGTLALRVSSEVMTRRLESQRYIAERYGARRSSSLPNSGSTSRIRGTARTVPITDDRASVSKEIGMKSPTRLASPPASASV